MVESVEVDAVVPPSLPHCLPPPPVQPSQLESGKVLPKHLKHNSYL